MNKLLFANLRRLGKNKLFIFLTVGIFILSAYVIYNGIYADKKYDFDYVLDDLYYRVFPYAGLVLAAFISLFIGTEYSDGTIRNKIIVGHQRKDIFIANLLICVIAATVFFLAWAVGGMIGIPHFGIWSVGIPKFLLILAAAYLSVISLTTLFTIITHLISSKSACAVTVMFLSVVLMFAGAFFVNSLKEPETICEYVKINGNTVEYGDEVSNPAYVSGIMRNIYEIMIYVIPTGQQVRIADSYDNIENPIVMILFSVAVTVITSISGYLFFRKKDLK